MRIAMCDICMKNKKFVEAGWRPTFKKNLEKFSIDVCTEHRNWCKGRGYDEALSAFLREEEDDGSI